ncbi:hypothetical protein L195_g040872 [Trifolium pratense]|uniref:Uncharacterized protein n=1 Tax=Trifolium pratense TaxID=57577 RepID=A0A2K3M1Y4_TRIPR|nr:hypothetical protein L195_g040872 [Trifolium pratense]
MADIGGGFLTFCHGQFYEGWRCYDALLGYGGAICRPLCRIFGYPPWSVSDNTASEHQVGGGERKEGGNGEEEGIAPGPQDNLRGEVEEVYSFVSLGTLGTGTTGGGGGDIGKIISFGGGDGGDDDGDDDDYFDDFDDGEEGDEGGLFRRRILLQELFDRKFVDAVLSEWQRTIMDLPAGFRQAYEMGLVSSAQMVKFLAMNARPTAERLISRKLPQGLSRSFIGR